jgi:predicted MPP superfamily phosphohydrolase
MKRDTKLNTSKVNDLMLGETTRHLWLKEANVDIKPQQKFKVVIMNGVLSEVILMKQHKFEMNYENNIVSTLQRIVNKVNFTDLNRRSVKLSSRPEQRINAFHRFQSLQASNITVESLNSSRINDIDVNHITHAVLLRDTEQNISNPIKFQDVIVSSNC